MKKIRLTEQDLQRIVKRVLTEQSHYDRDEMGNIIDDEGRIIKVMRGENPNIDYHRSRHTDDDSEYDWAHDPWGYLQNPTDNRSYRKYNAEFEGGDGTWDTSDEEGFEEVASFDDYDEYIKSGYCHPHDESCMRERGYFDKVVKDYGRPLKIYRRPKKK